MPTFDLILLIILGGFVLYGFWFGLIHTLGGLVGVIVASIVSTRLYVPIADWAHAIFGGNENVVKIVIFIILFILITRIVGFLFFIVDRIFRFISVIPFLKSINRLAGMVLGFIEGVFLVGGILFVVAVFPVGPRVESMIQHSGVARYLVGTYRVIVPLLPAQLREFDFSAYFTIPEVPDLPSLPELPEIPELGD